MQEGLAREFVRRVQDLRKTAVLEIADRIVLYYHATPGLTQAIEAFKEYIQTETLTVGWIKQESIPLLDTAAYEDDFDGEHLTYGLKKA